MNLSQNGYGLSLSLSLTLSLFLGRGMKGPGRGHVNDTTAVGRNCHNINYHDNCTKTNCSLLSRQNKLHNCHKKHDLDNCEGRQK